MHTFDILIWIGIAFIISLIVYFFIKRADIFGELPVYSEGRWSIPINANDKFLGKVEGNNNMLKEVVVVAHQIEEPNGGLLESVKSNFRKKVIYRFIISHSSYEEEKEKYIRVFQGYAQAESPEGTNYDSLVKLHKMNDAWSDVPYIFYRCESGGEKEFIFGYRGSQLNEGIADNYVLMEPQQAHTIFRLVEKLIVESLFDPVTITNFNPSNNLAEVKAKKIWSTNKS